MTVDFKMNPIYFYTLISIVLGTKSSPFMQITEWMDDIENELELKKILRCGSGVCIPVLCL